MPTIPQQDIAQLKVVKRLFQGIYDLYKTLTNRKTAPSAAEYSYRSRWVQFTESGLSAHRARNHKFI